MELSRPPGVSSVCPRLSRACDMGERNFLSLHCCKNPEQAGLGVPGAGTLRTAVRDAALGRPDGDAQPRVAPELFRERDLGFMKLFFQSFQPYSHMQGNPLCCC